jgi:hypothetical protein
MAEASTSPVKAYVIGDEWDRTRALMFVDMLRRHEIDVYQLKNELHLDGDRYLPGSAFIIPTHQPQYRLIRGIFEKTFQFKDSLFYDITSWTMPLAFGLNYAALNSSRFQPAMLGEKAGSQSLSAVETKFNRSEYGYLVNWEPFYTPAALFQLQQAGVQVRVATNPFEMQLDGKRKNWPAGTLQIPVSLQKLTSGQLHDTLLALSRRFGLNVHPLQTGTVVSGSDMGSSRFAALIQPVIATIVGQGVNALDAGEFWHLMDQRFHIPVTQLEPGVFNRVDLSKYNTLVLVGGNYSELNKDKLKAWVQNGGLLILTEEAISWAAQNGIHTVIFKKLQPALDSTRSYPYSERSQLEGAQQMSGAIFKADVDLTHPLAYGYHKPYVSLFKANKVFMEKSRNPFATPFQYKGDPLQSGWVSSDNLAYVKYSAAVMVNTVGSGRVISIADNPNFRAFWLGGTKLMMNAIFFGKIIDAASGRVE